MGAEGVGHVGEAGACYRTMARVLVRAGEVRDNVEGESVHVSNEGVIYSSCPNVTEQSLDARISRLDCLGEKNSDRKIFLDL